MLKKHVVVVGGGWAGIKLVRSLKHLSPQDIKITLISNNQNFRYSAALYRVATGHKQREAIIPIHDLIEDIPTATFVKGTMTSINEAKRTITTANGKVYHYDYAVVALGSETTYFNIPGVQDYSYSIKTEKELTLLRAHMHEALITTKHVDPHYIVIGAGPTGVELSAAFASYIKSIARRHGIYHRKINIDLIEASDRVLPTMHKKASQKTLARLQSLGVNVHLNSKVEQQTPDSLIVNGKRLSSQTVIWTAGVANNHFFVEHSNQYQLNNRKKVIVNDHLRTTAHTYIIGDNAVTPYSGLGLTAVHNAQYVARDITLRIRGARRTPPYKPLDPATVVPAGKYWAIFQYKKIIFGGWPASILRSMADFVSYHDIGGFRKAVQLWSHSDDLEESCYVCKTKLLQEHNHILGIGQEY